MANMRSTTLVRIVGVGGLLLLTTCTRLKPTPSGSTFLSWSVDRQATTTRMMRLRLRKEGQTLGDVDLELGATDVMLASAQAKVTQNSGGWTFDGIVTESAPSPPGSILGDADLPVARIMISATKTGSWGSHGNKYGSSDTLEVRSRFRVSRSFSKPFVPCAGPVADRDGELCER